MIAFSSDQLSRIVIPLLFAVFGGSIAAFGKDLNEPRRREAYFGLLALSLFCAIGLIAGVLTVQYQWLSPDKSASLDSPAESPKTSSLSYIRSQNILGEARGIELKYRQKQISSDQAIAELLKLVEEGKK
jgi:hypothetical protein